MLLREYEPFFVQLRRYTVLLYRFVGEFLGPCSGRADSVALLYTGCAKLIGCRAWVRIGVSYGLFDLIK